MGIEATPPPDRRRRSAATLALLLAACTARHGGGEQCVFNDDCAAPLVCAARRCRASCRTDRDCVNGTVCRPSGEFALRVCLPPEEPWRCATHEDCEAPSVCGPTRQCQLPCRVDGDCRFVSFGARCEQGVCLAPDAGGAVDAADSPDVPAAVDAAPTPDATAPDDRADAAGADRVAVPGDARGDDGAAGHDAGMDGGAARDAGPSVVDGAAAMDVTRDDRGDVPRPPTHSFLDVAPTDAPPPPTLRGVSSRGWLCAIRADGAVFCWGPNGTGALGLGADAGAIVSAPTEVLALRGAVELAMTEATTCARMPDGTVRCAGAGTQLGDGTTAARPTFGPVPALSDVRALYAGRAHFCALLGDATARCWGANSQGQVGEPSSGSRASPVSPRGLVGVAELALGDDHTCARLTDGTARCWGVNTDGQLGSGSTATSHNAPVAVSGLADVAEVAAGYNSSCARLRDGAVWCWGSNLFGALGDGTFTSRRTPVRAAVLPGDVRRVAMCSRATCVVHGPNREVSCIGMEPLGGGVTSSGGSTSTPVRARELRDVARFSAVTLNISSSVYTALRDDGTAVLWGTVWEGVLGPRRTTVGAQIAVEELIPP